MAYDKQKVINIALGEVGYLEKASNSNLDSKTGNAGENNYTKYARDLDAMGFYNGRKQSAYWCDVFVDWCFVQAYGKNAALQLTCQPKNPAYNCGAGCKYSMGYYKDKGRLHTSNPQPGDQIFYYGSDGKSISHTGLVYKVDSKKVYTVEGNTSGASGVVDNGGGVAKKSYKLGHARIAGYGRPDYGVQISDKVSANGAETPSDAPDKKGEETPAQKPGTAPNAKYAVYTVQRGDSLWKIAKAQLGKGSRYEEIKTLNGLTSDIIRVGQKLKIPKK